MPSPDRYDKRWIDEQLLPFPQAFRKAMLEDYLAEPKSFNANTNLRLTTAAVAKSLGSSPNLFSAIYKDEDSLHNEAKNHSQNAARVKDKFFRYGIDAVYFALSRYVTKLGINAPKRKDSLVIKGHSPVTGLVERMCDKSWWLRSLRKRNVLRTENTARQLNIVNKHKQIYVSDLTVESHRQQIARSRAMLESHVATNEFGYSATLAELSDLNVSNPIIRKAELNTRARGIEDLSISLGHKGVFLTMTCPSKYHSSYGISGDRNLKWDGSTPVDAQTYLTKTFSRIRSQLSREDISIYGIRVVEPHHDGTPHWHLLLFVEPSQKDRMLEVFKQYCFEEDGDEEGAAKYRLDVVLIDPSKGSATGYIVKYISKNIDGKDLDTDSYGEDAITSAQRVRAWASCFSIRQFQQIGGVSITVWRELRRLKEQLTLSENAEEARMAADGSEYGEFTQIMGGVFCKRSEQLLRPFYDVTFDQNTGELKESRYGDSFIKKLRGIKLGETEIITRVHQWTVAKSV